MRHGIDQRWPAAIVVAVLCVTLSPAATNQTDGAQPSSAMSFSLLDVFATGVALEDRNGDGVIDFVNARLVLGEPASAGDVSAGADIAARLGFETMAMNLPVTAAEDGARVSFVIGQAGMARAGLTAAALGLQPLEAGDGVVAAGVVSGRPTVVVTGGDDAGTMAAAELLAGRLPHVWDPKGPALETVAGDLRKFLADQGVNATSVRFPAAYVRSDGDAIAVLSVAVTLPAAADVTKAAAALRATRGFTTPTPRGRAGGAAAGRGAAAPAPEPPLSYGGALSLRVELATSGGRPLLVDVARAKAPAAQARGPRPGSEAKDKLALGNLYANEGLLGDSDNNLIPDRIDTLLSPSGDGVQGTIDLAARLGLESTGISIPIAVPPERLVDPETAPTLVLIGTAHPLVERLIKEKKFERPALQPGEGLIQVVRKAFGEKSAVLITGGDARGVAAALREAATRLPHIWARGKDRTTIADIEEDVRQFVAGRSPVGQAAAAAYKLDKLAADLAGKDLESAQIIASVEKPAAGFGDWLRREAATKVKAQNVEVVIDDRDVQKARTLFDDEFDVPSEVDDFWQAFRTRVLPSIDRKKPQPVVVEARLSEPPEVRAQIERDARAQLIKAGATEAGTMVTVLCAYKQGYSWLYDAVRPALVGKRVDRITIRFARMGPPPEWPQQAMTVPTRWLLELYPIDEILARELKLDLGQIRFEEAPIGSPAYEVIASAPGGAEILRQTFEPKFVLRSFFDQFPNYEKVRVTTGWIRATSGARVVADERIETDPERFWDHFEAKTLPAIYDYVMALSNGKPRAQDAPLFGELVVDLAMSEPSYRLELDNEQIASLESVQEEIYFHTLHFFDVIGRYTRGPALDYIGRVIPIVHPRSDGKPGHARITFSGFAANRPAVIVKYRERGGRTGEARLDIPKVSLETPVGFAARVRDGQNGLERLDVRVKVDTQKDDRAALIKRARAEAVDEQIISAEQVSALVAVLGRLRAAGLYRDALAYTDLGDLRMIVAWQHEANPDTEAVAALPANGAPAPFPDIKSFLPAGYRYSTGEQLVQWDTPIPPPEGAQILAKMSTFKEAAVYKVGRSYLGKDSWAMDLMAPIEASHWSQAKASTLKPTIIYSARQDANEVSSTSHTLKLAEMLLTDPEWRRKLNTVNVVFHPFTNPDGAQLAYDLYKITPDYMLHPGYLGPLGVSLVSRWDSDPIYPESKIRPKLWRTWLPDIFLNPHGYPSHEWVQLFSEYAAWVRNRVTEARDWQQMRGWFIPGFNYLDDPKYPRNKEAAFKIREMIARNINAAPEVRALNERSYDRYRRYAFSHDDENFKMDFTDGVLIYTAIKGAKADTGTRSVIGDDYMVRQPNVTIFFGSTEAPDETAHGDWMKLVATMGLQWDKANLAYLVSGNHVIERKGAAFFGGVSLSVNRPRPPKTDAVATRAPGR